MYTQPGTFAAATSTSAIKTVKMVEDLINKKAIATTIPATSIVNPALQFFQTKKQKSKIKNTATSLTHL